MTDGELAYFMRSASFGRSGKETFEGSTLILPIVSLGNVPQLAVDLLIENGECSRIGWIDPTDHIPVVGADDACPVEVYQTTNRSVTILQQRSPVLKSRKEIHVSRLSQWISEAGFNSILVLVSIDAATRTDAHLGHHSPFFHLITGSHDHSELRHHLRDQFTSLVKGAVPPIPILSAGGIARRMMLGLRDVNALLMYVAEGDSRPDAKALAHAVLKVLPQSCQGHWDQELIKSDDWIGREPDSWKIADVIHNETRAELFG
ncbi:hypothetical protein CROQUDRAFT_103145 [Cronartium quercuum f. sp. fusiforme G11]|uniref:Proteasome assembly chaperone 2 n=1 Tax=Cronartium quercuum f. sp. fusiforme G11 TaxID=708437 RepID=A0A9P6NRQ7_9BASI|nr:hypothetical protein CROQUDRAFT_103145 [Cronartium quercuum f. sp. fusiforme G11]